MKRQNRNYVSRKQKRSSRQNYRGAYYIGGIDMAHGRKGAASIGNVEKFLRMIGLMK